MSYILSFLRWAFCPLLGISLLIIPSQGWKRERKKCGEFIGFVSVSAPIGTTPKSFKKSLRTAFPWISHKEHKVILKRVKENGACGIPVDERSFTKLAQLLVDKEIENIYIGFYPYDKEDEVWRTTRCDYAPIRTRMIQPGVHGDITDVMDLFLDVFDGNQVQYQRSFDVVSSYNNNVPMTMRGHI